MSASTLGLSRVFEQTGRCDNRDAHTWYRRFEIAGNRRIHLVDVADTTFRVVSETDLHERGGTGPPSPHLLHHVVQMAAVQAHLDGALRPRVHRTIQRLGLRGAAGRRPLSPFRRSMAGR